MIHVFDKYFIETDTMNYIAIKKTKATKGKSAGKETKVVLGYFPSIDLAVKEILHSVAKSKLEKKDIVEVQEALKIYQNALDKSEKLTKKVAEELKEYGKIQRNTKGKNK